MVRILRWGYLGCGKGMLLVERVGASAEEFHQSFDAIFVAE